MLSGGASRDCPEKCNPGSSSPLSKVALKTETRCSREFFEFFKRIDLKGVLCPWVGGWVTPFPLGVGGDAPLSSSQ